jgi:predicted MFS family arabinose efflux permease
LFAFASVWMMIVVLLYTNLSVIPFWEVIIFNILMMMGILGRMIPSSVLTSAVPGVEDRGAFMSINASLQQIAGGVAAAVAGMIVVQPTKFSPLQHYNVVGYVVVCLSVLSIFLIHRVSEMIRRKKPDLNPAKVKI